MAETIPTERKDRLARDRRRKSRSTKLFIRDILLIFVAAVIISAGIKAFLIRSFYIPSGSMQNTLQINDRILVNEVVPGLVSVQHGDIVVFKDPGGWLPTQAVTTQNPILAGIDWLLSVVGLSAPDSNDHLIKRVIGLPGDVVVCCNALGQMTINGVPLKEPYLKLPTSITRVTPTDFDVTVPAKSLWVMGDNRYDSSDSAYHFTHGDPGKGFVPISDVVGRAFMISWPIDRWSWLDNFPGVFAGVENK
jgi:signal peptidase I